MQNCINYVKKNNSCIRISIDPELVRGTHPQSQLSDIYSYGVMMNAISTFIKHKNLKKVSKSCMDENSSNRPGLFFVCESLNQLIL